MEMRFRSHRRQRRVKNPIEGVKDASGMPGMPPFVLHAVARQAAGGGSIRGREGSAMADLAYAFLLIGVFGVLVLTVRGLEKL